MIRPARIGEAAGIARVHVASWRGAYAHIFPAETLANLSESTLEEMWARRIERDPASILVAELDGGVAGFLWLGPCRDPDVDAETVAEVYALYLEPRWWGTGHGLALWSAARQWIITREYATVLLWVLEENERGRRFYESVGFRLEPGSRRLMERAGCEVAELRYRQPVTA